MLGVCAWGVHEYVNALEHVHAESYIIILYYMYV